MRVNGSILADSDGLYTEAGYFNVPRLFKNPTPFNFLIGGRGIGKTYGILKYCIEQKFKIMLLRRTQKQTDIINKHDFSPLKAVCADMGLDYELVKVAKGSALMMVDGIELGYTGALSTFSGLRGFDMSDVNVIVYDEFIPEMSERTTISHEYETFLNAYETVNRNRELQGCKPVTLIAMANSNRLDNRIFMGLGLVGVVDKMYKEGVEIWRDGNRGITVYSIQRSPISALKADTALYRLAGESEYTRMALYSSYNIDESDIIKQSLREYNPVFNLGELCVYRHKSRNAYYVSMHNARGSAPVYAATEKGVEQVRNRFSGVLTAYVLSDSFYFDSVLAKTLFKDYLTNF